MGSRFKPERTVRLVPQVPFVISWLRHEDSRAGDLFTTSAKDVDSEEANGAWTNILESIDLYGDPSTAQLRRICGDHVPPVWAKALHILFQEADPRVVPKKVFDGLVKALGKLRNTNNGVEVGKYLAPELDKMRLVSLEAFGEFCAMIRDTTTDVRTCAGILGPSILLDSAKGKPSPEEVAKASQVMFTLCMHAEFVFGKPGTRSNLDPLGIRNSEYLMDRKGSFDSMTSGGGGVSALNRALGF